MRLSLSEISTVGATFEDDVEAYAEAGFDAIGIWELKLPDDDGANIELLRTHGLRVANVVPRAPSILQLALPGEWGPDDPEERIEGLCATIRRLVPYEPECVLFLTGPAGDRDPGEARALVADGIRRVAAVAREAGVRVALEPVHPTQAELTSFVTTVAAADELLAEAGADDVGVLLDTYHVWDDPGLDAWIPANVHRVAGLHVGDWPADRTRTDRELPGDGRSREIVAALRAAGWEGSLDVEVFSTPDGFWALPVAEAARQAHAAGSRLR